MPVQGAPIDVPAGVLTDGTVSVGSATCEVSKARVSAKEATATVECTAEQPVVIDTAKLTVGGVANSDKKAGPVLVWPGDSVKFSIEVSSPAGDVVAWVGAAKVAAPEAVPFTVKPMKGW